jgi:small subunit ribosomal protein S17
MDKTVAVLVERAFQHAVYGKIVRRSAKLLAHDAENACHVGDRVLVVETRPLSRRKRWRVAQILERAR